MHVWLCPADIEVSVLCIWLTRSVRPKHIGDYVLDGSFTPSAAGMLESELAVLQFEALRVISGAVSEEASRDLLRQFTVRVGFLVCRDLRGGHS
jgi:hypothetical protein